jgi:hypothetical protein
MERRSGRLGVRVRGVELKGFAEQAFDRLQDHTLFSIHAKISLQADASKRLYILRERFINTHIHINSKRHLTIHFY